MLILRILLVLFIPAVLLANARVEVARKPDQPWSYREVRLVDDLPKAVRQAPSDARSRFGGDARHQRGATGFFRVERHGDGWELIDPDGHPYFNLAVVGVRSRNGRSKTTARALQDRFGGVDGWAPEVRRQLLDHGFNGIGSWSETEAFMEGDRRVPYTLIWNFMSRYGAERGGTFQLPGHIGYPEGAMFVFDPGFEEFCNRHAEALAATANDPWLIGHFCDNELPLRRDVLDRFLRLPGSEPGRVAAESWLAGRRGATGLDAEPSDEERAAFLEWVAERYYRIVSSAIRRHDPNHLYLGSRLHGQAVRAEPVWRAAARHCDIISVNLYFVWNPPPHLVGNWVEWADRPFMITEFYAKGMDSGLPNVSGAGWVVRTQADRGRYYQHLTLQMMESPHCVGMHWFRYHDNDPEDLSVDPSNRDSNKGIVTIEFEPYPDLLNAMKELNLRAYTILDHLRGR